MTKVNDPADEFPVVKNLMSYKFSKDTGVYSYDSGAFTKMQQVSQGDIPENGWVAIDGIEIKKDALPSKKVCFVEGTEAPSTFESKDDAIFEPIFTTKSPFEMDIEFKRYTLPGGSAPRSALQYTETPTDWANTYGDNKHFHYVGKTAEGSPMVVWQDTKSGDVQLTTINEFTTSSTKLKIDKGVKLGCATEGEAGELFYITFSENTKKDKDKDTPIKIVLYKASTDGKVIKDSKPKADKDKGMSVWSWDKTDSCHLLYNKKDATPNLGLHYSRTNPRSPDGLNHQSAGIIFFDPNSLKVYLPDGVPDWYKNEKAYQTGSHSFGANCMIASDA